MIMRLPSLLHPVILAGAVWAGFFPLAARADPCVAIAEPVWFCFPPGSWTPVDDGHAETAASYVSLMQIYAQFFVDDGGEKAGQTLDGMVQVLRDKTNAAVPGTNVPVLESSPAEVDGVPGRTIVFAPTNGDQTAMITATIVVTPDHVLRFATVADSATYSENIRAMHRIFLSQIRLSDPNG